MPVPKQMISISVSQGSWRAIVDGKNQESSNFEGSWSGEVEQILEIRRLDTPESEGREGAQEYPRKHEPQ